MRYQPSVEKNGLLFVDIDSLQLTEQDVTQLQMFQNKEIVVFKEENYNEINFSINCKIITNPVVDTNPEFEQVLRSFAQQLDNIKNIASVTINFRSFNRLLENSASQFRTFVNQALQKINSPKLKKVRISYHADCYADFKRKSAPEIEMRSLEALFKKNPSIETITYNGCMAFHSHELAKLLGAIDRYLHKVTHLDFHANVVDKDGIEFFRVLLQVARKNTSTPLHYLESVDISGHIMRNTVDNYQLMLDILTENPQIHKFEFDFLDGSYEGGDEHQAACELLETEIYRLLNTRKMKIPSLLSLTQQKLASLSDPDLIQSIKTIQKRPSFKEQSASYWVALLSCLAESGKISKDAFLIMELLRQSLNPSTDPEHQAAQEPAEVSAYLFTEYLNTFVDITPPSNSTSNISGQKRKRHKIKQVEQEAEQLTVSNSP